MGSKVPTGVMGTAALNLVLGVFFILLGLALAIYETFMSDIQGSGYEDLAMSAFLHIVGGLFIFVGTFSIILSAGLLLMKDWARMYDELFFSVIIIGGLIFGGFVVAFLQTLIVCTGIAVTIAIISIVCIIYLRKQHTIRMFESYDTERKRAPMEDHLPKPRREVSIQSKIEATEHDTTTVNVPENMMLCPNCDALNLIEEDHCKICATELLPDSEETIQRAQQMMEYAENQVERGRRMGVDFTETETLLQGARMMIDARKYRDAMELIAQASKTAGELIADFEVLGRELKRAEEALDSAASNGRDTPEIEKLLKLANYHKNQGEYKMAIEYAKRVLTGLSEN